MSQLHYRLMSFNPSSMRDQSGYARRIVQHVCETMCVAEEDAKSRSRHRRVVECRQICMWIIKNKTNLSLYAIGQLFDRDHATVIFGIKNINNFVELNHELGKRAQDIIKDL